MKQKQEDRAFIPSVHLQYPFRAFAKISTDAKKIFVYPEIDKNSKYKLDNFLYIESLLLNKTL